MDPKGQAALVTGAKEIPRYQFLTNHAQVLLCLAATPDIRLRDVAARVGITERSTQRILSELVDDRAENPMRKQSLIRRAVCITGREVLGTAIAILAIGVVIESAWRCSVGDAWRLTPQAK